jgi:hypothetical protein
MDNGKIIRQCLIEDVFNKIKDEKIQNNMAELKRNAELILNALKKY